MTDYILRGLQTIDETINPHFHTEKKHRRPKSGPIGNIHHFFRCTSPPGTRAGAAMSEDSGPALFTFSVNPTTPESEPRSICVITWATVEQQSCNRTNPIVTQKSRTSLALAEQGRRRAFKKRTDILPRRLKSQLQHLERWTHTKPFRG